jgi:hypothetical protein
VCRFEGASRDGEVLDSTLGLCGVERVDGNEYFTHGVVLNAEFRVFSHEDASFGICSGGKK